MDEKGMGASGVGDAGATRRLPELLAPAGCLDAALAAIAAGADAVYTGMGALDARAAAPGIAPDELRSLCALAHARGRRVYVTLNALVYDDEVPRALAAARGARAAGADALIVADSGLCSLLARELPDMEVHLSTQAGVQAPEACRWAARELGCARVTVARELSLTEIASVAATGVPIEVFCHGAICISYAGACAASARRRGRSAMRGDCTQPCRLAYGLEDERGAHCARVAGDRLLCPRDYLGLRHLGELCATGVSALKIEGRMKNPDYVYNVVGVYRRALDAIGRGERWDEDRLAAEEFELGLSFNRGFTDAYLMGRSGAELMSFERAINQGVRVGTVTGRGRHEVTVALDHPVGAGDTFEIHTILPSDASADVPCRWPLVPCPVAAGAGECIRVRCKRRVEAGSPVYLVASARARAAAECAVGELRAELAAMADAVPEPVHAAASGAAPKRCAAVRAADAIRPPHAPLSAASPVFAETPEQAAQLVAGGAPEVAACAWRMLGDEDAWRPVVPFLTVLLDEVCRAADVPFVAELARRARLVICRNLAQVPVVRAAHAAFDVAPPLYAANRCALEVLRSWGARRVWLAGELPVDLRRSLAAAPAGAAHGGVGVLDLPREPLMLTEHCVLTAEGPCDGRCRTCARRLAPRYLVEASGARLPVVVDARGRTRIFDEAPASPAPLERA